MDEKKRGRPRKNATEEQLETIKQFCSYMGSKGGSLQFSKKLTSEMKSVHDMSSIMANSGMYQPIFSEQLNQAINFSSEPADSEDLAIWLQKPDVYSENLRNLSHYLENSVLQYGRSVSLLSDIKSYHYDLRCGNSNLSEIIGSDKFNKSYSAALNTLRKLNIPYQIRKLDNKVAKDGVAFVWFNKTKDTIDFLDLPSDFCYITAPWSYGYLFAIDLTYFDRFAFQRDEVPELWKAYSDFCKMRQELAQGTNVLNETARKKLIPYQYYPVSPYEGWCAVFDSNRPIKIPPMVGAAQSSIDSLGYRDLIKQKALIDLYRVLAFRIPINTQNNKMQITYEEATKIIDTIKSVLPENFVAFSSPFETEAPINADQTNTMINLETISNDSFYNYSAIPNALFNSDIKSSSALKLATNTLFAFASSGLYASMQNLVNWILRIECGSDIDWHIVFSGNKLYEDEEKAAATKLYTTMNFPVSYVMSVYGYEPFDIQNAYVIENFTKIKDQMKPIQSMNTVSDGGDGRPEVEDSNKSDSSEEVEDSGNE